MTELIIISKDQLEVIIQDSLLKSLQRQKQIKQDETDKFLSLEEASEFLQLAKQTLYGFTSQRTIPFIKRGKKLYFKKVDLEKWLNEGRKLTSSEIATTTNKGKK
ncbi:MAG: helix-turn-helix domain-containing protein [Flavobacterium sp.]|uniref:helix-turn-helix domain-containing protein n=1 Tax=Flavobacterium sp. TaxID=239 RepID=UPI003BE8B64C